MKNIIRRLFGRFYTVQFSNTLLYKGTWEKGVFHGYGELTYKNGSRFLGQFQKGNRHGMGKYTSSSGYIYDGEWMFGRPTGKCKITYKNGDEYEGFSLNGLRHGKGKLYENESQRTYHGYWQNDKIFGDIVIEANEWLFKGKMPDRCGRTSGELFYKNGTSYSGHLENFKRSGPGLYVGKFGEKIKGNWINELDVKQAKKVDRDGIYWEGNLENFQPHGFMNVRLPSGYKYDGVFDSGNLLRVLSVNNQSKAPSAYRVH